MNPKMNDKEISLCLGGTRSGKSRYAQDLALSLTDCPLYLATSRPIDEDHRARIARHQRDRGPEWETIEEPQHLSSIRVEGRVIVVDCVTLWLTNYFFQEETTEKCLAAATRELDRALELRNHWIFVSNEIGQGVHAPTESGRKFADLQGFMNQAIAARADRVALLIAGLPLYLKGEPPK